jgi:anthranilate synthase component 1
LESVEGGQRWGQYSFLGTSVRASIRVYLQHVEVSQGNSVQKIAHKGDPFKVLEAMMADFRPASLSELPRFWGGLVGYLTYEMVSFFEAIDNRWPAKKPLAHFIIPDELLIFDNLRHTLTIVVIAFMDDDIDVDHAFHRACARIHTLVKKIETCGISPKNRQKTPRCVLAAEVKDEDFRSRVERVKDHIVAGDVIQTVISQPFACAALVDATELYRAQRYINPSPYLYFLQLGGIVLTGSSPETMVRLENRVANLRPIAGTRPRGKTQQEDRKLADELLSDEKERAEHLMLVDLGRNDLGRVATTGSVQVTDLMTVERYSHVMHLTSNIVCDLKPDYTAWDLLRATFPAGTLTGAPKVRAMEIIFELESKPRGVYGGAVGYISFSGNMDMAITIRTGCIENGRLTVRAGAGIVADSQPETERLETVNKAAAIQKAVQLVQDQTIFKGELP